MKVARFALLAATVTTVNMHFESISITVFPPRDGALEYSKAPPLRNLTGFLEAVYYISLLLSFLMTLLPSLIKAVQKEEAEE